MVKEKRQACAIEVTPAMIEAGLDAFNELRILANSFYGMSEAQEKEGIKAIYLAMRDASSLRNSASSFVMAQNSSPNERILSISK